MGKLRVWSGAEVCTILRRHGFIAVRHRGSHLVMMRRTLDSTISVPVPDHHEFKIGTLIAIIRQSGVPRTEFG
jgi:predicted RNA binding protein YcfA (HicA-like mRNA interferase family)